MFKNIGNTIKIMAKVFWWVGTITIVGIILIWPTSWLLYGFGELVENSAKIAKDTNNTLRLNALRTQETEKSQTTTTKAKIINSVIEEIEEEEYQEKLAENPDFDSENIANDDECPACFHKIAKTDTECSYCGYRLK
ncbi:MAG: hypothetical protein E7368_04775 [Clostridiales bacterium]|nr:hypothetical protein [Clostridiales bacterium]